MAAWTRRIMIALLALGAAAAAGLVVWGVAGLGSYRVPGVERGLVVLTEGRLRMPVLAILIVLAAAAGALAWLARRRTWPILATAIAAPVGIAATWLVRNLISDMETPRYRHKSPYVRGATEVAIAMTIYLAVLAIAAAAAVVAERRARRAPPAPTAAPPVA